jgi:hypothetical protein
VEIVRRRLRSARTQAQAQQQERQQDQNQPSEFSSHVLIVRETNDAVRLS